MYLGPVFNDLVPLLQVLNLQLGYIVLSHIGPFHRDGVQDRAVAQHFLIEQL